MEKSWSLFLELPWPGPGLSPNARQHWSAAARARKAYRVRCRAIATQSGVGGLPAGLTRVAAFLTFLPPDRRGRDWDNMLASMKAGIDGLADALGIDDRAWRLAMNVAAPVAGGQVLVRLEVS